MKKPFIIPLVYGILLGCFGTYSVLDTLFIPKVKQTVSFDFGQYMSSNTPTSKTSTSKSSGGTQSSDKFGSAFSFEPTSSSTTSGSTTSSSSGGLPDVFSDTVIHTEDRYIDQNLHIEITTEVVQTEHLKQDKLMDTKVYCAEIYVNHFVHLRTAFSHDKYGDNLTEWTSKNARRQGAIFAINGDTYGAQEAGYVLRNGQMFRETARRGAECVALYKDGTMESFYENETTLAAIKDYKGTDSAWQVWSFGPALVKNGVRGVQKGDEVDVFSQYGNQRVSIGIIEPYHYICAVCDGRLDDSYGMQLFEMADYMISKGCKLAYNLDGGGSSAFFFNDELMNRPCTNPGYKNIKERGVSDIVYFA